MIDTQRILSWFSVEIPPSLSDLNLIHYAIPGFVLLIALELFLSMRMQRENYEVKDSITSITMGIGNVTIGLFSKIIVLGAFSFVYSLSLWKIPVTWWTWFMLFFLEDFSYYLMHRGSHRMRFFWASHVVHHSSQTYNLRTALRQTWTGSFFTFIFWIWLPFLGFHPLMIMTQMAVSLLYQFWIHTEVIDKMPTWYEWIFNTPSHHRVHHATNPKYLDRNHGGILIIWDRIFGTFEKETEDEKPVYGLTKNIETYNPLRVAFAEWINLYKHLGEEGVSIKDRLRYLIKPPGWRHDGTGHMSEDIRAEWASGSENQK